MNKKLTEEELLRYLNRAGILMGGSIDTYSSEYLKQAHNQIKEIIHWYYDNGVAQIVGDIKKTEDIEIDEILKKK